MSTITQANEADLSKYFRFAYRETGVNAQIIRSICWTESGLKPNVKNHKDGTDGKTSYGICQIKLDTAKTAGFSITLPITKRPLTAKQIERLEVKELMKPDVNILYAAKYFSMCLKRYRNDMAAALTGYNRGINNPSNVKDKYNKYVAKVLTAFYEVR